jgi:hypothetical protein
LKLILFGLFLVAPSGAIERWRVSHGFHSKDDEWLADWGNRVVPEQAVGFWFNSACP